MRANMRHCWQNYITHSRCQLVFKSGLSYLNTRYRCYTEIIKFHLVARKCYSLRPHSLYYVVISHLIIH